MAVQERKSTSSLVAKEQGKNHARGVPCSTTRVYLSAEVRQRFGFGDRRGRNRQGRDCIATEPRYPQNNG